MKKINHLPVNWTDGVKISSDHFFRSYNSIIETIKNYNIVYQAQYEYGLLEDEANFKNLELDFITDGENSFKVNLKSCNALTKKGYRIIYNSDLYGENSISTTLNASSFDTSIKEMFYIVLSISPFNYVPVGTPDPDVTPLHHPSKLPQLNLHVVSTSQINLNFIDKNFLIISKVLWSNGVFSLDKNYIPPVLRINSNKRLTSFTNAVFHSNTKIKEYVIKIFKKNNIEKNNFLSKNTISICELLRDFYCNNIFSLNNIIHDSSPVELIERLSIISNKIAFCLNIMPETQKEELLQYYYQWTDIKPSDFINSISDLNSLKYNHFEIAESFNILDNFITILEKILKKLSDLEYIGQRKDNLVINEDSKFNSTESQSNSWSIID